MLRQNSSHTGISSPTKTAAEMLREDADIEALLAAYRAVATVSAHSVFSASTTTPSPKAPPDPLPNTYQAASAAFANSMSETTSLPIDPIEETEIRRQPRPVAIVPANATDYVPSFDLNLAPPPIAEETASIVGATSLTAPDPEPAPNELETQAMQDALDDAMGAARQDNRMFAEEDDFINLPPAPETWLVKLCNRPRLAAGIIGMCVLSSTVYASIGYWFLNNPSVSNAAEPVNMMTVQEGGTNGNVREKGHLNNLDKLQSPTHIIVPRETEGKTLLAQAAGSVKSALDDDIASIRNSIAEPIGRANPFAPLLGPTGEIQDSSLESKKKKDVLEDLQFIGFIGDINSRDKVAMIKVNDPTAGGGKTLIKKAGDSFMVEGERVVLRGISKNFLKLGVSGENRMLSISPYTELADTTSASNASAASAGGAANNASPTAPAASVAPGKLGNLGALSKNAGNPTSPELQEPNQ